jgi:hypothetical protein
MICLEGSLSARVGTQGRLQSPLRGTWLDLTHGEINEGAIPVQLAGGRLGILQIYPPVILSSSGG